MNDAEPRRERLVEVYRKASVCRMCALSEGRTNVVFGAGDANAELMFVGEAPGAEEDHLGLPFVGRAGGLLNQLLEEVGLSRDAVFIANVLKCRPPGNRDPRPEEIETCKPYLLNQVELIQPTVIATLGNFATKLLTGSQAGITKVRGTPQVHTLGVRTVFVLPILHPAAALRNPNLNETMRTDFKALRELTDGPPPPQESDAEESAGPEPTEPPETRDRSARAPAADQLDIFGA